MCDSGKDSMYNATTAGTRAEEARPEEPQGVAPGGYCVGDGGKDSVYNATTASTRAEEARPEEPQAVAP